eukprot:145931-Amorphochlora_amoeboformis.AAC.3
MSDDSGEDSGAGSVAHHIRLYPRYARMYAQVFTVFIRGFSRARRVPANQSFDWNIVTGTCVREKGRAVTLDKYERHRADLRIALEIEQAPGEAGSLWVIETELLGGEVGMGSRLMADYA